MSYGRGVDTRPAVTLALMLVLLGIGLVVAWWDGKVAEARAAVSPPVVALHCQPRGNLPLWSDDGIHWYWPEDAS